MDCIFCKIAQGEIPSDKVYEDDRIFAFRDANPQAPVHVLIIPKEHIKDTDELDAQSAQLVGEIFALLPKLANELDLGMGYRVVTNTGSHGGQSVPHLHFHLLGGRGLAWPPG